MGEEHAAACSRPDQEDPDRDEEEKEKKLRLPKLEEQATSQNFDEAEPPSAVTGRLVNLIMWCSSYPLPATQRRSRCGQRGFRARR